MTNLRAKKVSQLAAASSPKWDDLYLAAQDVGGTETSLKESLSQLRGYAGDATESSAATIDLGEIDAVILTITGNNPVSSFGSTPGITRTIFVLDGFSLVNSSHLVCPQNANLVLSANDVIDVISDSSGNFFVSAYYPYNGFTAVYADFIGDSGSGGVKGLVPAPPAGSAALGYVLGANGSWGAPGNTTYASRTVTANYSVVGGDYTILCDATSGPITITLLGIAFASGKIFNIKKIDSSANQITITGDATIDGSASYFLPFQNQSVSVQCNGTIWSII